MIRNTKLRRIAATMLVVLGALLIYLTPDIWTGGILMASGVILEVAGIALKHKDN